MATELTGLLSEYVVYMPKDRNEYEALGENQKTKSLSLEELMPFQDDPWWQNIRRTFFFSFWITVILTFASACILSIIQHGSCESMKKGSSAIAAITEPVIAISTLITSANTKTL